MNTLDRGMALHTHRALADKAPTLSSSEPPEWVWGSVCTSVDLELFYPDKGGSPVAAKKICAACPVRAECAEWALATDERHGVFGGLSERERHRILAAGWTPGDPIPEPRHRYTPQACPDCGREFKNVAAHQAWAHPAVGGAA